MSETKEHFYGVDLSWKEGRSGVLSSPELDQEIEVTTPPPFDGGIEGIWSPEHLFVAAVSSCFMTTFTAIAEYSRLKFENLEVNAVGELNKKNGKFMVTQITLQPTLVVPDDKSSDKAMRLMQKAEEACLITRSIKTEIIFKPKIVVSVMSE
jgi:peroxiredoxin-like protein